MPSCAPRTVLTMTEEPQEQPLLQRSDPKLILDAVQTGAEVIGVGYAIAKGIGKHDPPTAPPPAPEPPSAEPPMPGFNE
jgi:hypothetical protein